MNDRIGNLSHEGTDEADPRGQDACVQQGLAWEPKAPEKALIEAIRNQRKAQRRQGLSRIRHGRLVANEADLWRVVRLLVPFEPRATATVVATAQWAVRDSGEV